MTGIILLVNRLLDLVNVELAKSVFAGRKTFFWYMIPILYGGYFLMFTKPFFINARVDSLITNPYVGFDDIKVDGTEVIWGFNTPSGNHPRLGSLFFQPPLQ